MNPRTYVKKICRIFCETDLAAEKNLLETTNLLLKDLRETISARSGVLQQTLPIHITP